MTHTVNFSNGDAAILAEFDPRNLEFAFELLDHYAGPPAERQRWLANQWTSYGDDTSDERWAELEADAAAVIRTWLARRSPKPIVIRNEELVA